MGVEIERKFTVKELPKDLESYPFHEIEQAYLNVNPAIRVRREDHHYYMTYKCKNMQSLENGDIGQTEYNMPLTKESYEHLLSKADGNIITKKRYLIPINGDAFDQKEDGSNLNAAKKDTVPRTGHDAAHADEFSLIMSDLKIELDVFQGVFEGRILAEVEFPSEEAAKAYRPADWFKEDVTGDIRYSNSHMSTEHIL